MVYVVGTGESGSTVRAGLNANFTELYAAKSARQYSAMTGLVFDITKDVNTKTIAANETFTLSGTPTAGTRTTVRVTSDPTYPIDGLSRLVTVPTYYELSTGLSITNMEIPAGTTVDLNLEYSGTRWEGRASNALIRYFPNQSNLYIGPVGRCGNSFDNAVSGGNIAIGMDCFIANISGGDSQFMGAEAGRRSQSGVGNMGYGRLSLTYSVTGGNNTAFGDSTLRDYLGSGSAAFGYVCLNKLTTGLETNAFGRGCGNLLTVGDYNQMFGNGALGTCVSGSRNHIFGHYAGYAITGNDNCVFGYLGLYNFSQAGIGNPTGDNACFGNYGGFSLTTGSRNTFIGTSAGSGASQRVNAYLSIGIGYDVQTTKDYQVVIGNVATVETNLRGKTVINSSLATPRAWLDITGYSDADYLLMATGTTCGVRVFSSATELQVQAINGTNNAYMPMVFTSTALSFFGVAPIARQTHAAVATDLPTAITRINTLCNQLTNYGLHN